jgi:hypothetical protein
LVLIRNIKRVAILKFLQLIQMIESPKCWLTLMKIYTNQNT